MACLNVAEWTPEQVADWLSGENGAWQAMSLGPTVAQYIPGLAARGLDGRRLLMLRCDDLEYLGMHVIGHQELLLEAVEYLRNFHYELNRECIQQLAMRVYVNAECVCRSLAGSGGGGAGDGRLDTQALAEVARAVAAVKPLAGWLDRWAGGAEAREQLLRAALEAAASAQRERFAERPARAVAVAAARAAAAAERLATTAVDPTVLRCATLSAVSLRQGSRPLGFRAAMSPCARHQVCSVRFGSPAHASGALHEGDEIVSVGARCVVGWGGRDVLAACEAAARLPPGELQLRLRRRAARPPRLRLPPPAPPPPAPAPDPLDSDDSGPLSPPASPAPHPLDNTRIFLPKPVSLVVRRHSVSGGSPTRRADHTIDRFWHHSKEMRGASAAGLSPEPDETSAGGASGATGASGAPEPRGSDEERRARLDKAHSTPAYELDGQAPPGSRGDAPGCRGDAPPAPPPDTPPSVFAAQLVVPLPLLGAVKADQILDFKKSSTQIGEAMSHRRVDGEVISHRRVDGEVMPHRRVDGEVMLHRRGECEVLSHRRGDWEDGVRGAEAVNVAVLERRRDLGGRRGLRGGSPEQGGSSMVKSPPAPQGVARGAPDALPVLRAVRGDPALLTSPLRPTRIIDAAQISLPLRHVSGLEARPGARRGAPTTPRAPSPPSTPPSPAAAPAVSPSASRSIFPTSKSRSLKKKNSLLARRRAVGAPLALAAGGAGGAVWQRVRGGGGGRARWARRWLVVAGGALLAYRAGGGAPRGPRALAWLPLGGCAAQAAPEVRSRPHAFKVYRPGCALYFAATQAHHAAAWLRLLTHHATVDDQLDIPKPFSETEYSDTTSEEDSTPEEGGAGAGAGAGAGGPAPTTPAEKDKSKFGSLKKLTGRMQRSESQETVERPAPSSLDRKYLRFFSRRGDRGAAAASTAPPSPPAPPPAQGGAGAGAGAGAGLVTLEQFMLQAQAEERAAHTAGAMHLLAVSEAGHGAGAGAGAPTAHAGRGKDGYEKIVYPDERLSRSPPTTPGVVGGALGGGGGAPPHLGQALRRNDRVHSRSRDRHNDSWSGGAPAGAAAGAGAGAPPGATHSVSKLRLMFGGRHQHQASPPRSAQYPHLVCPPTFQPESYSLRPPEHPPPPPPPSGGGGGGT